MPMERKIHGGRGAAARDAFPSVRLACSGQESHADYALGWGFGNGWTAGIGGYVYRQVGATVLDNKGRAMGIGPSIKFDGGKWMLTA